MQHNQYNYNAIKLTKIKTCYARATTADIGINKRKKLHKKIKAMLDTTWSSKHSVLWWQSSLKPTHCYSNFYAQIMWMNCRKSFVYILESTRRELWMNGYAKPINLCKHMGVTQHAKLISIDELMFILFSHLLLFVL